LLSDSQTRVVYQQASNELRGLRDPLQLTDTEVSAVDSLAPGTGLWKVGQRSFVVQHAISRPSAGSFTPSRRNGCRRLLPDEAAGRGSRRRRRSDRPRGGVALRRPGRQRLRRQPALAGAPSGLVTAAFRAGPATGIDPNVLLAIAKVETDWGQARNGQPDDLVPPDIQAHVDIAALQPGGATMSLLGLTGGRRIGDWVNPQPVGPAQEHAVGFMQFLPSTWRVEAAAAPGRPQDPYRPLDAMVPPARTCTGWRLARSEARPTTSAARWRPTAAAWRTRTRC
jgi:hypothetical protein